MRKAIATIVILLAAATAAAAQTPQFMEVYDRALTRFDQVVNLTLQSIRKKDTDDESLRTSEFSGKMLRSILPDKADDEGNLVNRIDVIRQIKFSGPHNIDLYDRLRRAAEEEPYERISIMTVDKETVYIYSAPYKESGKEFLIFIAKGDARLACDIVGDVTLNDVTDLLFGRN